jgi:hypothetical protein
VMEEVSCHVEKKLLISSWTYCLDWEGFSNENMPGEMGSKCWANMYFS